MSFRHAAAGILFGAAFVYVETLHAWSGVSASGATILDLTFTWSPSTASETLRVLGPSGAREYMQIAQSTDIVCPLVYACLFAVGIDAVTPGDAGPVLRSFILLPAISAAADFVENLAIVALCRQFLGVDASAPAALVFVGGRIATPLKWSAIAASLAVIVFAASAKCARHGGAGGGAEHYHVQ